MSYIMALLSGLNFLFYALSGDFFLRDTAYIGALFSIIYGIWEVRDELRNRPTK